MDKSRIGKLLMPNISIYLSIYVCIYLSIIIYPSTHAKWDNVQHGANPLLTDVVYQASTGCGSVKWCAVPCRPPIKEQRQEQCIVCKAVKHSTHQSVPKKQTKKTDHETSREIFKGKQERLCLKMWYDPKLPILIGKVIFSTIHFRDARDSRA